MIFYASLIKASTLWDGLSLPEEWPLVQPELRWYHSGNGKQSKHFQINYKNNKPEEFIGEIYCTFKSFILYFVGITDSTCHIQVPYISVTATDP
jgi:hypothetical protein